MGDSAYSFSLTTFSRTGKLLQIEYALNAVANGRTALGIAAKDGVVIATDKKFGSALVEGEGVKKVEQVTDGSGFVFAGVGPDYRVLGELQFTHDGGTLEPFVLRTTTHSYHLSMALHPHASNDFEKINDRQNNDGNFSPQGPQVGPGVLPGIPRGQAGRAARQVHRERDAGVHPVGRRASLRRLPPRGGDGWRRRPPPVPGGPVRGVLRVEGHRHRQGEFSAYQKRHECAMYWGRNYQPVCRALTHAWSNRLASVRGTSTPRTSSRSATRTTWSSRTPCTLPS